MAQFFVEEGRDVGEADLLVEERLADRGEEDEGQGAGVHLLVVQHVPARASPVQLRPSAEISLGRPAAEIAAATRSASAAEISPRRAE